MQSENQHHPTGSAAMNDRNNPKRLPLTCERYVDNRLCGHKAIGASFDCNGEYGIGYCERHEPLHERIERLKRDHPAIKAYADGDWITHLGRVLVSPYVAIWKRARRGR